MIKRVVSVATAAATLLAGLGVAAHAEGRGARQCPAIAFRVPGEPAGAAAAAMYRADRRDYFTDTVVVRYSARTRWSVVSVVPKHC